ncbi:hypothetical protein [Streptomyces sp. RK9]|uniref:hypothetical protein n=1 Tax=Streptomyces sp. RK9 TaxID=3239284 RepID=UPI00386E3250
MTSALEVGDAATWGGTLVTLLVALYAVWQGHWQAREQAERDRLQTEAAALAHRQVEAAERRAYSVERMIEGWIAEQPADGLDPATPVPPGPGSAAEPAPTGSTHAAHWTLTRKSKHMYVLRNDSTLTVTGVHVDDANITFGRALPEDGVLRPGESAEFMMAATLGGPLPNEIWVRWDGVEEPVAVPVP